MDPSVSVIEKQARLALLNEMAYLAADTSWELAKEFYYSVMLEIERGRDSGVIPP